MEILGNINIDKILCQQGFGLSNTPADHLDFFVKTEGSCFMTKIEKKLHACLPQVSEPGGR